MASAPPPAPVAVAGATGWLGRAVVAELVARGYAVVALCRGEAPQLASTPGVTVRRADALDPAALEAALEPGVSALISCVGLRDAGAPPAAMRALLRDGTLNLFRAATAARARRVLVVAGGIHRTSAGAPNTAMEHNQYREEGLALARGEAAAGSGESPSPALIAVDPSVFFKDAETIFAMISTSAEGGASSLTLVGARAWSVACSPVSGRDLAARLVDALVDPVPPAGRLTVGGPARLTFGELADAAGAALGVRVARRTLPVPVARALLAVARGVGALGVPAARKVARFLAFLIAVGTDESPGGLCGTPGGADRVEDLFARLAADVRAAGGERRV